MSPDGRWRAAAIALIVLSGFSGRYLKVGLILYLPQVMLAAGGGMAALPTCYR